MKAFKFVFSSFVVWRIYLFVIAFISVYIFPKFGNTYPYADTVLQITKLPNWIWGFGGFDGVHYLKLAQDGYTAANYQAFFPAFPLLIKFFNILPRQAFFNTSVYVDPSFFYIGLLLANLCFIGFLYYFYLLLRLDFSEKDTRWAIIILLLFPTSFYFGSIYTESLFLLLAVSSVYFFRTKKYLLSGIIAAFASATRIVGMAIPLIFIIEMIKNKDINWKKILTIVVSPLGLSGYLFYLMKTYGNAFIFMTSQPGFGAERSALPIISLPQVIYRYLKILTTVDIKSLVFFNATLEFSFTLTALLLLAVYFRKVRLSYLVYAIIVIIIPTMTGTLSSMPRYLLAAFPIFPLIAQTCMNRHKYMVAIFVILQAILLSMFIRGYWVA